MQEAATYDPLATAATLRVPVLYAFGAKDSIVPAGESLEGLMQASARGHVAATFLLFPNAGHGLPVVNDATECHECIQKAMLSSGVWDVVPGFLDAMKRWLDALPA